MQTRPGRSTHPAILKVNEGVNQYGGGEQSGTTVRIERTKLKQSRNPVGKFLLNDGGSLRNIPRRARIFVLLKREITSYS